MLDDLSRKVGQPIVRGRWCCVGLRVRLHQARDDPIKRLLSVDSIAMDAAAEQVQQFFYAAHEPLPLIFLLILRRHLQPEPADRIREYPMRGLGSHPFPAISVNKTLTYC